MEETVSQVDELRAELDELRQEVRELRAGRGGGRKKARAEVIDDGLPTRRSFLGLAGAAAAGAVLGAVAGNAEPAEALTNDPLLMGIGSQSATGTDRTRMFNASGTDLAAECFQVDNYSSTFPPAPTNHRIAIIGQTAGADTSVTPVTRTGVYGRANIDTSATFGQGVFGSSKGIDSPWGTTADIGVMGTAGPNGWGVVGYTPETGGTGVLGQATSGVGVWAFSSSGLDLKLNGGRMFQRCAGANGAPTTGAHEKGEMIRDLAGDIYLCIANGTPGTWRKVTAAHPSYAARSGSINLLSKPVRIFDSRVTDGSVPLGTGGAKLSPSVAISLAIAGTWAQGIQIPTGAKAVLGNLTCVYYDNIGWAVVYPDDAAQPATSNVNFSPTVAAVANSFVCGLSAAGKMKVLASVATHAVIDITGFVY